MPRQDGALDAGRHVGDGFQGHGVFQFFELAVVRDLAFDHAQEEIRQMTGLFHGLSLDEVDHQRRRGLRNGAAGARKGRVLDDTAGDLEFQGDFIAAAGVMAPFGPRGMIQVMPVFGIPAFFRDEFRIDSA